jgi:uncharacterized protein
MPSTDSITINSRKYDQSISRSWRCSLIDETDEYYLFKGTFESEVTHSKLGTIKAGTISYEYYWKKDFFNVFVFYEPYGEFRNYYCNLNLPPEFHNDVLDYVDLDIDILVWGDFSVEILDMDEFEAHAEKFKYPTELQNKVKDTLDEILQMIEQRQFPFDENTRLNSLPNDLKNINL